MKDTTTDDDEPNDDASSCATRHMRQGHARNTNHAADGRTR